jgi:hypothetical protein
MQQLYKVRERYDNGGHAGFADVQEQQGASPVEGDVLPSCAWGVQLERRRFLGMPWCDAQPATDVTAVLDNFCNLRFANSEKSFFFSEQLMKQIEILQKKVSSYLLSNSNLIVYIYIFCVLVGYYFNTFN